MDKEAVIDNLAKLTPFPGWDTDTLYPYVQHSMSRLEFDTLFVLHSPSIFHAFQQLLLNSLRTYAVQNITEKTGTTNGVRCLIYKHLEDLHRYKSAVFSTIRNRYHLLEQLAFPLRLSDLIWVQLGDISTDMNYYSKRGVLAGIYVATLAYWYTTNAPITEVFEFFEHRLENHFALIHKEKSAKSLLKSIKKNIRFLHDYFSTH